MSFSAACNVVSYKETRARFIHGGPAKPVRDFQNVGLIRAFYGMPVGEKP
jgi:hypothetical protein